MAEATKTATVVTTTVPAHGGGSSSNGTAKPKGKKEIKCGPTRKKACGLVLKTLDIEMFRIHVTFALRVAQDSKSGFTASDVDHFYTILGEGSRDMIGFDIDSNTAGFFHSHRGNFIMGTLMYAGKGETFPRMDLSTIAHETDHCATGIMNYLGMNVHDNSGDEFHAYLHGNLMRHLYKFLITNNVVIHNGN